MRNHFKIIASVVGLLVITTSYARTDDKNNTVKRLLEIGEYDLAKSRVQVLAESDTMTIKNVLELSELLTAEGLHPTAIHLLDRQRQFHPQSTKLLERLADFYLEVDESPKAIPVYEDLVKLDDKNRAYWLQLGKVYSWNEQSKNSMHAYEKAVSLDPSDMGTIRQLHQLYQWNERPKSAYALEKVMLSRNPGDINLWKEHGIHARWLGKHDEAMIAFKNVIKRDRNNVEAFFLLGETAMWSERQSEAEICFRHVLKVKPQHQKARLYLAQLNQYKPFQWKKAKDSYEGILVEDPYNQESKNSLRQIREDFGPSLNSSMTYLDDSNNLKLSEVKVLHNRYVTAHWQIQAQTIYRRLEEQKSLGKVRTDGTGLQIGGTWFVNQKSRFVGSGGFIRFDQDRTFGLLELQFQHTLSEKNSWPGQVYSSTYIKYDQVVDGALAILQNNKAKRIGQNIYWKPTANTLLSGDIQRSWYTDKNDKIELYVEGEYRFYSGKPALFLNAVYAYQDMRFFFPDSEPYWTPKNFWTRSIGPNAQFKFGKAIWIKGGYSLTQQTGEDFANNWMMNFLWQPNTFSQLTFSYHDYGSKFYAYRSFESQFSYRF